MVRRTAPVVVGNTYLFLLYGSTTSAAWQHYFANAPTVPCNGGMYVVTTSAGPGICVVAGQRGGWGVLLLHRDGEHLLFGVRLSCVVGGEKGGSV